MQQTIEQTGTDNTYERLLKMPTPVMLLAMWLAGTTLLGMGVLTLYLLVATVGGA
jgi:hypothetical protein